MDTINLIDHCRLTPISYNTSSVLQLPDNSLLVIPAAPETVNFFCPKQQSIETLIHASLIIPSTCTTKVNHQLYAFQEPDTISLRLKLPPIQINEDLQEKIEPIALHEINLESIHLDLDKAKRLTVHPLIKLDSLPTNLSISTLIITSLVIVVLVLVIFYYYKRSAKKQNVQMAIQLKPFENTIPLFSHT